jgi:hypothetical protein
MIAAGIAEDLAGGSRFSFRFLPGRPEEIGSVQSIHIAWEIGS